MLHALEVLRGGLALVLVTVGLLWLGAKLERAMQKRQLQVLDGAAAGVDVDAAPREDPRGRRP